MLDRPTLDCVRCSGGSVEIVCTGGKERRMGGPRSGISAEMFMLRNVRIGVNIFDENYNYDFPCLHMFFMQLQTEF